MWLMVSRLQRGGGRMVIALALTLGPTLAFGYFGYGGLAERERGLRVTYAAAANLIRDRLSAELTSLQSPMPAELPPAVDATRVPAIQSWLLTVASQNPWATDLFVTRADEAIVTPTLRFGWSDPTWATAADDQIASAINRAEDAEFVRHDFESALQSYREALGQARSTSARALARSRIARTLVKLHRVDGGLAEYRALLTREPDAINARGLPYAVMAREEIVDGLDALGRPADRERAGAELLNDVVRHPWDAEAGYRYHLKRAIDLGHAAPVDVQQRAAGLLAEAEAIERLHRDAAPRLLRAASVAPGGTAFGYTVRPGYVTDALLPKIASDLDLGQDIRVSIAPPGSAVETSLASLVVGDQLPGWQVAIIDAHGRTLQQLSQHERWTYGAVLGLLLAMLVAGVVFTTRAWAREAELSKLRRDFVSNVSHELKTPLALIRMFGETLESGLVDDASRRQEFYGIIRRESERLTHLINNVLDTAKIEAGTRQFALEQGDLVALVREALDAYVPLFTRLNFAVDATLPDRPLSVRLDRDAVAQALVNLFQNAIRYSDESKHVAVSVEAREREVVVSVADHGIGIPAAELPRIFDKFYRTRSGQPASSSSSGLGLSIVKHVMQAHGGRVEVQSVVGQGSVFALVFPVERAAA